VRYPRPRNGFCYLDFLDHWLLDAIFHRNVEAAVKYARESARWALKMHPELAYDPHNVVRGSE